jgi:hypothetical protein
VHVGRREGAMKEKRGAFACGTAAALAAAWSWLGADARYVTSFGSNFGGIVGGWGGWNSECRCGQVDEHSLRWHGWLLEPEFWIKLARQIFGAAGLGGSSMVPVITLQGSG